MYQALISAANHPDPINPYIGLFNFRSIDALSSEGVTVNTVSPRPLAPSFGPYSEYSEIPTKYRYKNHTVHYPRFAYLVPQKLFKYNLSSMSISRALPRYVSEHFSSPDICHAGHIHYDGYGLLPYCRKNDIPLTVMGRGKILNNYGDTSKNGKKKIKETLDFADHVFCVSDSLANIAGTITDDRKVTVLPNGADPSRYPTKYRSELRDELEISPETTLILFCGGYTERKGILEIAEAIEDIRTGDLMFVFIGHYGSLRERLIRALNESSHESYEVLWEVSPLALRRWFAIADIFMLPSHAEGRPNTVYEAMASETPVVASAVSGIPEQVADGETGILIPPEDPPALAAALNTLISDETRRTEMGKNGVSRLIENDWTWEAHAGQLMEIHKSLI